MTKPLLSQAIMLPTSQSDIDDWKKELDVKDEAHFKLRMYERELLKTAKTVVDALHLAQKQLRDVGEHPTTLVAMVDPDPNGADPLALLYESAAREPHGPVHGALGAGIQEIQALRGNLDKIIENNGHVGNGTCVLCEEHLPMNDHKRSCYCQTSRAKT